MDPLQQVRMYRNDHKKLSELLPSVACTFKQTKYEKLLLTQLRSKETSLNDFRSASKKLSHLLAQKVIECLPTTTVQIATPLVTCPGEILEIDIALVSILRSGDALLEPFLMHFPNATVSKILVQRDEETAQPHFKYMKLASDIEKSGKVIILEPMIATGGTLEMVISILIEKQVRQEDIIIASFFAAPEGIIHLQSRFNGIKIIIMAYDERLNENKYIVPGLGDFGDRLFGTTSQS
jgi:uracil phosphoribosyltransferase